MGLDLLRRRIQLNRKLLICVAGSIQTQQLSPKPRATKKMDKILGVRKKRQVKHKPKVRVRHSYNISNMPLDIEEATGLGIDQFYTIVDQIANSVSQSRSGTSNKWATVLTPTARILMVLHWIRQHCSYSELQAIYSISKGTISKDIHWIAPKIYAMLDHISWPSQDECEELKHAKFHDVIGAGRSIQDLADVL